MKPKKQQPTQILTLDQIKEVVKDLLSEQDKRFDKKLQKALENQTKVMFEYFVTKEEFDREINEIKERLKNLPSKDEYFKRMDEVVKELETTRGAMDFLSSRVYNHVDKLEDHEERIAKLEQRPFLTT